MLFGENNNKANVGIAVETSDAKNKYLQRGSISPLIIVKK